MRGLVYLRCLDLPALAGMVARNKALPVHGYITRILSTRERLQAIEEACHEQGGEVAEGVSVL